MALHRGGRRSSGGVPSRALQAALILDDTTVGNIDDYDLPTADPEICGPLLQCK